MNVKTFKGGAMLGLGLLLVIAAVVLAMMNLGNKIHSLHFYWRTLNEVNLAAVMLLSAAFGAMLPLLAKLILRGVREIRGGRLREALTRAADKVTGPDQPAT